MNLFREIKNTILYPDIPTWIRKKEIIPVRVSIRRVELEQSHRCKYCETPLEAVRGTYLFGDEVIVAARSLEFRCPRHHELHVQSRVVLDRFYPKVKEVYSRIGRDEELRAVNAVIARDQGWKVQGLI